MTISNSKQHFGRFLRLIDEPDMPYRVPVYKVAVVSVRQTTTLVVRGLAPCAFLCLSVSSVGVARARA